MKIAVLFAFLLFGSAPDFNPVNEGEETSVLRGKVVDAANHEWLAGAEVRVKNTDIKVYCDMDGNFELRGLDPGVYEVEVRMVSYERTVFSAVEVSENTRLLKFCIASV